MINEDIKNKIKEHLEDYLQETGRNTRGLFNCLNPSHEDKNPSMSYNPKKKEVHCFSCNTNYDLISLYALDNGFLDDKDYFIRSCKELAQKYNISVPVYQSATRGTSETPTTTKEDFTRYYAVGARYQVYPFFLARVGQFNSIYINPAFGSIEV